MHYFSEYSITSECGVGWSRDAAQRVAVGDATGSAPMRAWVTVAGSSVRGLRGGGGAPGRVEGSGVGGLVAGAWAARLAAGGRAKAKKIAPIEAKKASTRKLAR